MDAQWAAQLVRAGNASVPCPPWPSRPPPPPAPIFVRRLTDHSPSTLSTGSHEPDRAVRDRRGSVDKSSPGAPAPSGPRCPGLVPAPRCPPGRCCACVAGSGHARALVLTATLARAERGGRKRRGRKDSHTNVVQGMQTSAGMGGGLSGMQPGLQQQLLMQHVGGAAAAGGVMAKAQDSGDVMAQVCLHAWAPALCALAWRHSCLTAQDGGASSTLLNLHLRQGGSDLPLSVCTAPGAQSKRPLVTHFQRWVEPELAWRCCWGRDDERHGGHRGAGGPARTQRRRLRLIGGGSGLGRERQGGHDGGAPSGQRRAR